MKWFCNGWSVLRSMTLRNENKTTTMAYKLFIHRNLHIQPHGYAVGRHTILLDHGLDILDLAKMKVKGEMGMKCIWNFPQNETREIQPGKNNWRRNTGGVW